MDTAAQVNELSKSPLLKEEEADEFRELGQATALPRDHVIHIWQEELKRTSCRDRQTLLAHEHQEGMLQEQVMKLRYTPVHELLHEHQMHRDFLQDSGETARKPKEDTPAEGPTIVAHPSVDPRIAAQATGSLS